MFEGITQWQKETFPKATSISKLLELKDEVDELKRDIVLDNTGKHLGFATCFILLFGAAASAGMKYNDIINAISEQMDISYKEKFHQ